MNSPVDNVWSGMESAPRDGTHILIAFGEDGVHEAAYSQDGDDPHPWKFLDDKEFGHPIFNGARDDKYGPSRWQHLPLSPSSKPAPSPPVGVAEPVAVKALEWLHNGNSLYSADDTTYVVDGDLTPVVLLRGTYDAEYFDRVEDAMSAAQAYHERHIRSYLVTPPKPVAEIGRVEAATKNGFAIGWFRGFSTGINTKTEDYGPKEISDRAVRAWEKFAALQSPEATE